jgi:hypothetical protein
MLWNITLLIILTQLKWMQYFGCWDLGLLLVSYWYSVCIQPSSLKVGIFANSLPVITIWFANTTFNRVRYSPVFFGALCQLLSWSWHSDPGYEWPSIPDLTTGSSGSDHSTERKRLGSSIRHVTTLGKWSIKQCIFQVFFLSWWLVMSVHVWREN